MLKEKVKNFPSLPGVYLMKDKTGKIIYVGKASNLRSRVLNYFRKSGDKRVQIPFLMARLRDVDYLVTDSEKEALILENNLIKKHRPRFNIYFRDDKNFYSLRLDLSEDFPRPILIRRRKDDGALYFGPYSSSRSLKNTLRFLRRIFPFRSCGNNVFKYRSCPCLYYQMDLCPAPCVGLISSDDYREIIDGLILFLKGKADQVLRGLRSRMKEASEAMNYEDAARLLKRIEAIEETLKEQRVSRSDFIDQDLFAVARKENHVLFQVLSVRSGKVVDRRTAYYDRHFPDDREALESFLVQLYAYTENIPQELILPTRPAEESGLKKFLEELAGRRVKITVPLRGKKKKLLDFASENALHALEQRKTPPPRKEILIELQKKLGLENYPARIECFDISNLEGTAAVGSMTVFREAEKSTKDYRHYRIRTVKGADDFAMMAEVITRRGRRFLGDLPPPDLIIVDGGKGQLSAVCRALKETGVKSPDVIALAKEKMKGTGKIRDRVFIPNRWTPIQFPPDSELLRLLMRIRDEAHRFAVTHHRKIRLKAGLRSTLDGIPGVGPVLKNRLLRRFQTIANIKKATPKELAKVKGISLGKAHLIKEYFNR